MESVSFENRRPATEESELVLFPGKYPNKKSLLDALSQYDLPLARTIDLKEPEAMEKGSFLD